MLKAPHHHHCRHGQHRRQPKRRRHAGPEISDEYLFKINDTEHINIKVIQQLPLKIMPLSKTQKLFHQPGAHSKIVIFNNKSLYPHR
jgi:hypothetical protein